MKKAFLFTAMLAIAASCSVSEINPIKEIGIGTTIAPEITASYENNGTKTTIATNDEGVGIIWWKPADEINVFYGTLSVHYTSKNKENATTVAFGTTDIIGSTESASENIWGLYPYDENAECDGESVTTTIPATQQGVAGTFDDDIFTSLAHSTSTVMTFYNVLGGIKFSLSRDDIKKITFKGNNSEDIAGKVKLEMDANGKPAAEITEGEKTIILTPKEGTTFAKNTNYYIVMLPTVLSNGFTMTFETETKVGTFEYTEKSIEIKRSVFSKKENIDSYATFISKDPELQKPFTITGNWDGSSVTLNKYGNPDNISLEYRKGSGSWLSYSVGTTINLDEYETLQFRATGENETFSKDQNNYYVFEMTRSPNLSGNIMSLLDKNLERLTLDDYTFYMLFSHNALVSASNLKLPAPKLAAYCYAFMFAYSMLAEAPELPAETLAEGCYQEMFTYCCLTIAPSLPATVLSKRCYQNMFIGNPLVNAPSLPAKTLADNCYQGMFWECSKLNYVKALFETTPSDTYTDNWLSNVSSTGTFVKSKNATWDVTGPDGIPEGWTVQIAE